MQVKVFYGDKTRVVHTMRTATYAELLAETAKEFELPADFANIRLRSYNVPSQTMQETYTGKEGTTLEELRIYPQKSLALEVKKSSEKFEEFDPTNIQIKVNVWRPGIAVLDEAGLKPFKLTFKKTGKMEMLVTKLAEMTSIPKERVMYESECK